MHFTMHRPLKPIAGAWPGDRYCLFEPAVHSAFSKALHAKVTILLDLTIVRHVVRTSLLIFSCTTPQRELMPIRN